MNAINVIHPFKYQGEWVFDDESKELDKEPFVAGADVLIDMLTNNAEKCTIVFSETLFPGADHTVTSSAVNKADNDGTQGTFYYSAEFEHDLWLCPALLKYFDKPPKQIHFQIKL